MMMHGLRAAAVLVISTTAVGLAGCSAGATETPSSSAAANTKGATTTAGPQGPDGAPGATGPEGPAGPAGPSGAKGLDGADGAEGLPGARGGPGETGPTGAHGATGAAGAAGVPGADGAAGSAGATGDAGLSSLVNVSNLSLGDAHCPAGGVKIEVGRDTDRSGTLESSEIEQTTYACQPVARQRVVFATSQTFDGNLGGIAGADAKCMAAAAGASSLAGKTFRAWVSTASSSPAASFTADGSFVTVGGAVLADTFNDMREGTLMAKVTTETGAFLSTPIWTGTAETGYNIAGDDCSGWTDATAGSWAARSSSDVIQWYWSFYDTSTCDQQASLYCVEQ
jgi:hypothetical protein